MSCPASHGAACELRALRRRLRMRLWRSRRRVPSDREVADALRAHLAAEPALLAAAVAESFIRRLRRAA